MRKQVPAVFVFVLFMVAVATVPALQAQDRVSIVGTIELDDGVPILVAADEQIYDLEGTDLSDLNGKRVEVTGTLIESEGAPLIQVEHYQRVQ